MIGPRRLVHNQRPNRKTARCLVAVLLAAVLSAASALSGSLIAQESADAPRLGTVDFPTSGTPQAQEYFTLGLLYLHSFEYGSAATEFRKAQKEQPDFALAYWGEAMAHNHPLWRQRDRDAAIEVLERLAPTPAERIALAPTDRERMYMQAAEALWADGPKAERDTAYMLAMRRLVDAHPDDPDARAFYALSLLGLSDGVRVIPTYMRAAAVVEELIDRYPDHPGVAHYMIHSYDDPIHAPLGLRAARAYSEIAPDAAHAQHMTTHIFLALGMWADVVSQNIIAAELTSWRPGHYTAWLGYGLAQQGRIEAARQILERAHDLLSSSSRTRARGYMLSMRADYLVNTERWSDPAFEWEIDEERTSEVVRAKDAFALGVAALQRGERDESEQQLARMLWILDNMADSGTPARDVVRIMTKELSAVIGLHDGLTDGALEILREATAIEDALPLEFGPPDVVKPSHELLGEMLLGMDDPSGAVIEFQRALALAPLRALSLRGLGRAAAAASDEETALRAYRNLLAIWAEADPGIEGLDEARSFVSARASE